MQPPAVSRASHGCPVRLLEMQATMESSMEVPPPCPFLPACLWTEVARQALAPTADPLAVLRTAAALLATSQHVRAATRDVCLHLDLRSRMPEEALPRLLPLLSALRCGTLLLGPQHAGGEALLRAAPVAAASARSLRCLAASLACTDTLARYPALRELHLHAGLSTLYPAVLDGVPALRRLGLHGYRDADLSRLPPGVAASLQELEVTPRPEALRCRLALALPPGLRVRRLAVHGSFHRILSSAAAPAVTIDTRALAGQCEAARIEARHAAFELPAGDVAGWAAPEAALAAALVQPRRRQQCARGIGPPGWRRLELHVLEGAQLHVYPEGGLEGLRVHQLDLAQLAEAAVRLGGGRVQASLRRVAVGIVHPQVLQLEWAGCEGDVEGDGSGSGGNGGGGWT